MNHPKFPIPEGVVEVSDENHLGLVHFELKKLKPKGSILFNGEKKEIQFQFFGGESREEGVFAKLVNSASVSYTHLTLPTIYSV